MGMKQKKNCKKINMSELNVLEHVETSPGVFTLEGPMVVPDLKSEGFKTIILLRNEDKELESNNNIPESGFTIVRVPLVDKNSTLDKVSQWCDEKSLDKVLVSIDVAEKPVLIWDSLHDLAHLIGIAFHAIRHNFNSSNVGLLEFLANDALREFLSSYIQTKLDKIVKNNSKNENHCLLFFFQLS